MVAGGSDDVGIENVVIDEKFFVAFHDYSALAKPEDSAMRSERLAKSFTIEIERV